jgi:hypothetical protein
MGGGIISWYVDPLLGNDREISEKGMLPRQLRRNRGTAAPAQVL